MLHLRRPLSAATAAATALAVLAVLPVAPAQAQAAQDRPGGTATWDSTSFVVGTAPLAVHGTVPGGRRQVQLQVKTRSGWLTLKKKRASARGRYRISTPLDWYGTHQVRVYAPGRPAYVERSRARVSPGYTPVGSPQDYAYFAATFAKTPRFDPCQVVRYKVNVSQVDPGNLALVQEAMRQVSAATGINVRYTGTTDIVPAADDKVRYPGRTNLVIAFGTNAQVPAFAAGEADGLGGARFGRYARTAQGKRVFQTTQAGVTLQVEGYRTYNPSFTSVGKPGIGHLMLHEIGHAFGLGHVGGTTEMMYAGLWSPDGDGSTYHSRYEAGDLTGLSKVGLAQGCFTSLRGRLIDAPAESPALP